MPSRIKLDAKLEREIDSVVQAFRNQGINAKRPDVLRLFIDNYKEKQLKLVRKPKSKKFKLI